MRIVGASSRWYRVELPDGSVGFVEARLTETIEAAIRQQRLVEDRAVLESPRSVAAVVETASRGMEVPVLGTFRDFLFVQSPSGRTGWMTLD